MKEGSVPTILLFLLTALLISCGPALVETLSPPVSPTSTPAPTATAEDPVTYFWNRNTSWRTAWFELYNPFPVSWLCAGNGTGPEDYCLVIPIDRLLPVSAFEADWSPDGTRLAIAGGHKLILWTPGSEPENVLESEITWFGEPVWSPDGEHIALTSDELQRPYGAMTAPDIVLYSLGHKTHVNLTKDLDAYNESPDWSPDARRVIFASAKLVPHPQPNYPGERLLANFEIILVDILDPQNPLFLTESGHPDISSWEPHWSPDGEQIAFLSNRSGSSPGLTVELFVMNSDGSGIRQITQEANFLSSNYTFYWLPDGRSILINGHLVDMETGTLTLVDSGPRYPFPTVWRMPAESSSLAPLPPPPCAGRWSHLAPDSYAIVTAGDLPNRVRTEPSLAGEIIQQIYPQTVVHVLEGPVCADGLVYWKVEHVSIPGGIGWTAEGDGTEYYLEPLKP